MDRAWLRKRWAQVIFLLVGTVAGCYNHYIKSSPMLAVAHYFVYFICSREPDLCRSQALIRCHKLSMYVQQSFEDSVSGRWLRFGAALNF